MRGLAPVVFTAHGNPMNALGGTPFAEFLGRWGRRLAPVKALVVVSAHFESRPLAVTSAAWPETVHDFYGFPEPLYRLEYPAPGDPTLAKRLLALLHGAGLEADADEARGLDHGAWAPLRFLFPGADVPVVELSLEAGASLEHQIEVGRALAPLRDEGILILASGNLVHNLRTADLGTRDLPPAPWAAEFDRWVEERLLVWDLRSLAAPAATAPHGARAHPTLEHYAPLLVACGAAAPAPAVSFPFTGFEHGTISMRCVELG